MTDVIVVTPQNPVVVTVGSAVTPSTPSPEVVVYEGQPGPQGIQGETGATGPQGPKGDTPVIAYAHTQNAVSSTWNITHNLGFHPNVTTTDASKFPIEGDVTYGDTTSLTIEFGIPTTGYAYLS